LGQPCPIVFFLSSFHSGGTEHQMVQLIRRLDRRLFRVHIACVHQRGSLLARAVERVDSIAAFPLSGFGRVSAVQQLIAFGRWCRRVEARIVHTCELYANIFGLPGAAAAGVPVRIANRRGQLAADTRGALLACQRMAYRAAHVIVANSDAASRQLQREGVRAGKIAVISNGLDMSLFAPAPNRHQIRRIVMVANLRVGKGHDVLIDAAVQVANRHPDVEFHLAGDGPLRDALMARAGARAVQDRFHFKGYCDDVPTLLAASDLLVLPSRSEASPNALIEAMAAGLPVVATPVGGIPELITPHVNGELVPPDDPHALADCLLDLMERPVYARALGAAARAHVEQRYSFDRMVSSFETLYLTQLERGPIAKPAQELVAS